MFEASVPFFKLFASVILAIYHMAVMAFVCFAKAKDVALGEALFERLVFQFFVSRVRSGVTFVRRLTCLADVGVH